MTPTTHVEAGQRWRSTDTGNVWEVLEIHENRVKVLRVNADGKPATILDSPHWWNLSTLAPPWMTLLGDGTAA